MNSIKCVAIYVRVSTVGQDAENQLIELRRYVQARQWQAAEYVDHGKSGAKTEEQRPALKSLMQAARKRQIDAVVVWSFDRFARSIRQLVDALDSFRALDISFISLREGVDTTTANGRLMFGIFASLAEFERELIRERVILGLNKARMAGKKLGRPNVSIDIKKIEELKAKGLSARSIARELNLCKDTVRKLLRGLAINPIPNLATTPL